MFKTFALAAIAATGLTTAASAQDAQTVMTVNQLLNNLQTMCQMGDYNACNTLPAAQAEGQQLIEASYYCQMGDMNACGFWQQGMGVIAMNSPAPISPQQSAQNHMDRMDQIQAMGAQATANYNDTAAIMEQRQQQTLDMINQ